MDRIQHFFLPPPPPEKASSPICGNGLFIREQRFTLPHLNLEVARRSRSPLLVVFGVHKEKAIVFVRDLLSLPGSSFEFLALDELMGTTGNVPYHFSNSLTPA